ncbi:MAG TPA: SDR family oxidoreductase, partial [Armatimonadetes bacterium]|nr:SDR family oxidoreductase [Armatimonadota bacterium]
YLVTGGAGFIGSHLVEELVRRGEQVRVVDNLSTGRAENLAPWREDIEFLEGDLSDPAVAQRAVEGVDYVLHQAALPSVPRSVEDPRASHEANVTGTLNLLLAARDAGVKRVVYAGSSSAYGDTPTLPKHEAMPPAPLSPYAASKLAGEYYCRVFHKVYGLETVVLRYFNIFGPRQDPTSQYAAVIPKFITALLRGDLPTIYGDGEQSRDFTYVRNVVEANLLACTAPAAVGEVINVATGTRFTINELFARLRELCGCEVEPLYAPPRPGDVRHSQADIGKAERLLGYRPVVSFREGLKLTVDWFRNPCTSS